MTEFESNVVEQTSEATNFDAMFEESTNDDVFETETETEVETESEEDFFESEEEAEGVEGEDKPIEQDTKEEVFTLKHLGETKEVNREQVEELAQKGLDYDRIRAGYDEYKNRQADLEAVAELTELMGGKPLNEIISGIKIQMLNEKIEERKQQIMSADLISEDLAERMARLEIESENQRDAEIKRVQAEQQEMLRHQEQENNKNKEMAEIAKLVELYPELQDKDFKLPQEVIDDVRNNGLPLGIAYPHYVNKQKELMIEQLQQAEKNRERNVGSMKSKSTSQGDAFLSGFLSDY